MATTTLHPSRINPMRDDYDSTGPFGPRGAEPSLLNSADPVRAVVEKMPANTLLWAGLGAMGMSILLRAANQKAASKFVGQLTTPLLIYGMYSKLRPSNRAR